MYRPHFGEGGEYRYTPGCTGHDEPELDPVSAAPGSALNVTWTAKLPADGKYPVDSVGPTFWWGGTVADPSSLYGQAFLELQFYPDSMVVNCGSGGGYRVTPAPNTYTACSPVWKINPQNQEVAAFNTMLRDASGQGPLVMHALDEVQIHIWAPNIHSPIVVDVLDLTTGHRGGYLLISKTDGPLTPAYTVQRIGDALKWGIVYDTPMSFVWEIGHTGNFTTPPGQFCLPGQTFCDSYDATHWAGMASPLQIEQVTFGDGSHPTQWAVVSDFGGAAEVAASKDCPTYGRPYCIYPWFTYGKNATLRYGVDYPGTMSDFGKAAQFQYQTECPGPGGPRSTYCDTVVRSQP